ncbi:hypothetical protein HK103_001513 [Boothiomyces macroporosus]|uniref:Uncharacterized protein n=1 Tax=Boothiomyces macroporosus TaxID=261099 RepID=A0AAD5UMG9_9FUNG|nr:hypothetical protein HK103_001513 [Boothiomyces macroporosus]
MSGYPNNNQSSGQRPPNQAKFAPRQSSLFRVPPEVVSDYRQKTKSLYQNEQNDSSSSVNYAQQNGPQFKQPGQGQYNQVEQSRKPQQYNNTSQQQYNGISQQQYNGNPQPQYNPPSQPQPQPPASREPKLQQRPSLDPGYSLTSAEIPIKASPIVLDYQQKSLDPGRKNSSPKSPTIDSAGQVSIRSGTDYKQGQSSDDKANGASQEERLPRNGSKISNGSDQMLDEKKTGSTVLKGLENKTKPELLVITKKMLAEINIKNRIISEANHNTNWLTAELSAIRDGKKNIQDPISDFQKSVANSSPSEEDKLMLESLLKLKGQLEEAKSDIEKHEASLLVLEKKRTVAEEEAAYLRTLTDRNADVKTLEGERIKELEVQLKKTVEDYTVLQSKVSQWARASKRNQEGRIAAEAAQKTLEEDIRALKSELKKKGSGDKSHEKQIVALQQTLSDTRNQLQVMEDNLNDAYTTIDQLETESISMQEKLTAEYARLDELNETAENYRIKCEELQSELAAQSEYAEIIKKRSSNASTILDGPSRSEVDELMEKNAFLEGQLKKMTLEHEEVQENHRKLQIAHQELQYNFETAAKKNEKLTQKLGPEAIAQEEEYMKRMAELEAANNFAIERQQQAEVDIINLKRALALTKSQTPSFQELKEKLQEEGSVRQELQEKLDKALAEKEELIKKLEENAKASDSKNVGNGNTREITSGGKSELENQIELLNIALQEEKDYAADIAEKLQALQGDKEDALAQVDELSHALAEERNTSETLYQQIQDIEAEQDSLMNKMDSMVAQLKQERATNEAHQNTILQLRQNAGSNPQPSELDKQFIELKETLSQEREAYDELNEKLQILGNEKTLLMNKVQELNETVSNLTKSSNADLEKEILELNETLAAERDAYDEVNEKLLRAEEEKTHLFNQIQQLQQDLESMKSGTGGDMEAKIQELTETLEAEREAYDELAEKMQILSEERNQMSSQIQKNDKELNELNESLLAERDAYDDLTDKMQAVEEEKFSLLDKIQQLSEKLETVGNNDLAQTRSIPPEGDTSNDFKEQIQRLSDEKTQLIGQVEKLQLHIQSVNQTNGGETEQQLQELNDTLNAEREHRKSLEEKVEVLSRERERLIEQVHVLESQLNPAAGDNHNAEIQDLTETLNAERDAYDELNEKMLLVTAEKEQLLSQIQQLQEQIASNSSSGPEAENEIRELNETLNAERDAYNELDEKLQALLNEKEELLKEIQVLEDKVGSHSLDGDKQIEVLTQSLMAEKAAYEELSEQMIAISDEKNRLQVELEQVIERLRAATDNSQSETQLAELNQLLTAEKEACSGLNQKLNSLGEQKSDLEAKLAELNQLLIQSKTEKQELAEQIEDLKKEIDLRNDEQSSVEDLSNSLQEEKSAFEDLTHKMQKLSSEKAELLNQVEEANDLLAEERNAYTSLAQKMQSIQIEKSELYQQVEELEVRLSTVGANTNGVDYAGEIGKLQQQLSEAQDNIEMLQLQLEERTQDVELLEERLAKSGPSADVGKLNAELTAAKSALENQATVIQEQLATIAKLDEQIGSEEDKIHTLESELANLYEKVMMMNNLESEIEEKDHEIQRNKHIMNELKSQVLDLEDTKAQIEQLKGDLDKKIKEIEELHAKIKGLEQVNAELKSQKQALDLQLENLKEGA